jgi:hypothetical protein
MSEAASAKAGERFLGEYVYSISLEIRSITPLLPPLT